MFNKAGSMQYCAQTRMFCGLPTTGLYFLIILSSLALSSCEVGPDFKPPDAPKVNAYNESKLPSKTASTPVKLGASQHFAFAHKIPGVWWALFRSAELNALIEQGIANSPTLESAQAALRQSQETMKAFVGNAFYPAVNGVFAGMREKENESDFGMPNQPSLIFNLYNASVNVSYTLDFFGANRRNLEALCAQVEYNQFLVEAAYLSLTANIVTTAVTEASYRAQIQATKDLIKLNQDQLDIINQQFNLGGASQADVLTQVAQLEQVKATLPPLEKNLSVTRHALSTLIGAFPSDHLLPDFYLDKFKLPTELPISIPSKLVRQRPDIRASEALLHQATAEVGVATANLYPNITLNGSYGYSADSLNTLFTSMSNIWSFGGQIAQPIFNGGALAATRRAAIAANEQAFANYRQTVLQAFQNVADSLRALEVDARALKTQAAAESAAEKTLNLTKQQFQLGAVNYLILLNAQQQYQLARIKLVQAQAARLSDTAALFQAMGGGWWNSEQKSEQKACNSKGCHE